MGSKVDDKRSRQGAHYSKEDISLRRPSRLAPSRGKRGIDDDSSHQSCQNSTMKWKKSNDIPLASLKNDNTLFQKFKSSEGVEVGPFHLKFPLELPDDKLTHFIFNDSLLDVGVALTKFFSPYDILDLPNC